MRTLATPSLLLLSTLIFSSHASSKQGDWFVHGSAITSFYQYEEDDARKELPDSIQQFLDAEDFVGDDSDYLNTSFGLGYYLSNELNLSLTYTSGIELNFLDDLFTGLLGGVTRDNFTSDADLQLLELDLSYKAYQFSPSMALFLKGGIVVNKLDVDIRELQDGSFTRVIGSSQTKLGGKLGIGLQWDFADNWALKGGYSHLTFLSMDKTYLQLEYRF